MDKLLSLEETADILGISEGTLRNWVYQRRVEFVKVGRRVLFRPKWIESFVEGQTFIEKDLSGSFPKGPSRIRARTSR